MHAGPAKPAEDGGRPSIDRQHQYGATGAG